MLKTLEEPPAHLKFILATTDPQKIPVTVLSRCLQFNLKQIPLEQLVLQLKKILELEKVEYETEALSLLARAARGSVRDALSLLDQAIAHGGGQVVEQSVRLMLGSVEQKYLYELVSALARNDGVAMIAVADRMAEQSLSFETALIELAAFLHRIALAQTVPALKDLGDAGSAEINELAAAFSAEDIQLWYDIVIRGRQDLPLAPDEYAGFTMILMRMLAFAPVYESSQPHVAGAAVPAPAAYSAPARAVAAPVSPPAPVTASASSELKKKIVVDDWNTLVHRLPLVGMERMLAHNCELVACRDERIELTIPHAQRHLNDRAYHERLKQVLEQHFGAKVKLEISVGVGNGNTVAEIQNRENQQRKAEAEAEIGADPFVRDLVENLDARVLSATLKSKGASQ
jgi:DNA polymerase-3 subunit gamma/tau